MAFFERFRIELQKFADGVHQLGSGCTVDAIADAEKRLQRALPAQWRAFYQSFDGAVLFAEMVTIEPLAQLAPAGDGAILLGECSFGLLEIAADGRVYVMEDDEERVLIGSSAEAFVASSIVYEGALVDREGEFKDVFDEYGDVKATVRGKQLRAALKQDAHSALYHRELAELLVEGEDLSAAIESLHRAVQADAAAPSLWAMLGALDVKSDVKAAEQSYAKAAACARSERSKIAWWAQAARIADPADKAHYASQAVASREWDEVRKSWLAEVEEHLDHDEAQGAEDRLALLRSIAPADAAIAAMGVRVQSKKRFKVL